jgi:hypothetical protein
MSFLLAKLLDVVPVACPACSATFARSDENSQLATGAGTAALFLLVPVLAFLSAIGAVVYRYYRAERD